MFIFVVGVFLAICGVVALIVGDVEWDSYGDSHTFHSRRYVGFPLMFLAGLCLLISGWYTQSPGDVVVIKGLGGDIDHVDTTAGAGFTMPWNKTSTFDITNQKIEMFTNSGGDGADGAAISAPVEEGTNVDVSVTVGFSQRSECIEDIVRNYRTESQMRERALRPGLRSEVRKATARYSAFEIKQHRGDLETDIAEQLNERWHDNICAEVESIDLGDLKLDETTEAALSRVTERQAGVQEAQAELEAANVRRQEVKVNALAAAEQDQITRCGATTEVVTEEVAGVETEVVEITPVPLARCQNLLNEQVILNNYINALEEIGHDGNLVVVDSDVQSILNVARNG